MGMVSGLLPVVGVPLPLISQGGTALIIAARGFRHHHVRRDRATPHAGLSMVLAARRRIDPSRDFALFRVLSSYCPAAGRRWRPAIRDACGLCRLRGAHGAASTASRASEAARAVRRAERKDSILEAIARPAEKRLSWGEYRKLFITPARSRGGVAFWRGNEATLDARRAPYGVPPEIVVAIIGVETRYGDNMGSYRVIDALATLAFDYPPRAEFFRSELEQFLFMAREQGLDPLALKGSYAGAMGMGSSFPAAFAATRSISMATASRTSGRAAADAIGSVANYFSAARLAAPAQPVVVPRARARPGRDERMNPGPSPDDTVGELAALGTAAVTTACRRRSKVLPLMLEGARRRRVLARPPQFLRDHPLQPQPAVRHGGAPAEPGHPSPGRAPVSA